MTCCSATICSAKRASRSSASIFNDQVASAEVLDPYKIKFTFAPGIPYRDLPATLGGIQVFSKADYEKNKRDLEESTLDFFLGTGPYVLDSMKVGQQIIYKRNPDYWGNNHPLNIGHQQFRHDPHRILRRPGCGV